MLKAAIRSLLGQPGFVFAAAGTLALGIAAPTAVFSTVNAALLKPLPYPHPEDIYTVRSYFPSGRFTIGLMGSEEMTALQRQAPQIQSIAMGQRIDGALDIDGNSRPVVAYGVSGGFFDLFGVPMVAGRAITAADGVRGAPPVVVLSHALWENAFGGRPDVVGSAITFQSRPLRVVAVAPATFGVPAQTDLWISAFIPESIGHAFDGYLRLRPGATLEQLEPAMTQTMTALGRKYPDQEVGRAYRITPLLTSTVGDLGPTLIILFAATGLLLVLAAVNVINLMLARGSGRAREMAVRTALGAGRGRIIGQLLVESVMVSVGGGLVGVAAAFGGVRVLLKIGAAHLPRLDALSFDARVAAFVAAVVIGTGVLVGLVPAVRLASSDLSLLMNEGGRTVRGSRRTRRLLGAFIALELATSVAVVAGASRLVASYDHLQHVDPGFIAPGRLVFDVVRTPRPERYAASQRHFVAWWQTTEEQLRQAGAQDVAAASSVPLEHEWDATTFTDIVSKPGIAAEDRPNARLRVVTPSFFSTVGIRLIAGRAFTDADGPDSQSVTIVNEAFVHRFLSDRDPLREQLKGFNFRVVADKTDDNIQVVGVVADVKYSGLMADPEPIVYVPLAQTNRGRMSIVVTTADGLPEKHLAGFRRALLAADPRLAIESTTLSSLVSTSIERQRLGMWLMSGFGFAALLLATVGVFGVVAYGVSQRTAEMAIRQALGATRAQVFWSIFNDAGRTALPGLFAGLLVAWWTGRLIAGYVFGVAAGDPVVLAVSVLSVTAVALAAMLLPARRAARLEPARALRE